MAAQTPVLAIRDLRKSFGPKVVHRGVDLELRPGEILALFGGSGSGKSVILRSIIGLEKPDSGSVLFEGRDITALSEKELIPIRVKIAFVFQNGALFDSMTVEENLSYPLQAHTRLTRGEIHSRVDAMLEKLGLSGSNALLPGELSGGMQKRVGLARAIILEPRIILFDEPTAGLDPINTKRLLSNIQQLKATGITGIFVTHDIPSALEIADRIAFLHEGRIYLVDTVENAKKSTDPLVQSFLRGSHHPSHPAQEENSHP